MKGSGTWTRTMTKRLTAARATLTLLRNKIGRAPRYCPEQSPGPKPGGFTSSLVPVYKSGGRRRAFSPNLSRGSTRFQDGVPRRSTSPSIKVAFPARIALAGLRFRKPTLWSAPATGKWWRITVSRRSLPGAGRSCRILSLIPQSGTPARNLIRISRIRSAALL